VSRDRLLVIDADLPKRLAPALGTRSRNAISAAALGLADNVKDPELLRALAANYGGKREWVLVTGDDGMPAEHGDVIRDTAATIATIHPEYPDGMTQHAWRIDVVQRWAHAMQDQKSQTVRRYTLSGSQVWKPRRRQTRQIALHGWTPWMPAVPSDAARAAGAVEPPPINPLQEQLPGFH
jgi:hypothetical protein